jgi:hypothetical protein
VPRADIVPGRERYELIDDSWQVLREQLRFEECEQLAGINGPLVSQHRACRFKCLSGRAPASRNENPQGFKSDRLPGIFGKLKEALDENRAEQLRCTPCRIEDLTGGLDILGARRVAPGMSMIDAVHSACEITDDVPLASKKLTPTATALMVPTVPLIGRAISSCLPLRFHSDAPLHNGGQRRYQSGGVTVRATDAVCLVELDRQLQRVVPLGPWRRRMLTPNFEQAHRKPGHPPDIAVPVGQFNASVATVPSRKLDRLQVRLAHIDAIVEHSAHE